MAVLERTRTTLAASDVCQALWYTGLRQVEIRTEKLPAPGPEELRVRTAWGAISRGTEALIFAGRVPQSECARMRAPFMAGDFPFPVKYGYAVVGTVETGPADLIGRNVFVLHPHQTLFNAPCSAVTLLPDEIPPRRAVLAANMETALNAVWDGAPGPADRIGIVGAGVIGSLVAFLCARISGVEVVLVDVEPARVEIARALGVAFAAPDNAPTECDCVFHASGSAAGLATAIACAGDEASIVELSWHGAGSIAVPLGAAFHSRRLRLVSSQVAQVSATHRPRWTTRRRLAAAIQLLNDDRLDALLAPPLAFNELPARLPDILAAHSGVLCQLIAYD
jgi:threonine dehydrogenase-like Zn-dependent dehydrogenase